jgi:hypothetical protein
MYTRNVNVRALAFVVALCLGLSPIIGAVCELDCDAPQARQMTQECHAASELSHGTTVRAAAHACGHQHADIRAFVAGPNARETALASSSAVTPHFVVAARQASLVPLMHGPPSSTIRTNALSTVLRI